MRKYILILTLFAGVAALSGCANMVDSMNKAAGIGVVSEDISTFDGAKIIKVSPSWLYEAKENLTPNRTKLGARWSNASPDDVVLELLYESSTSGYGSTYLGITGIDININGNKSSYSTNKQTSLDSGSYNTVSKTIYTESENSVVIPLSLLTSMVSAKDVRIRIYTSKGYEDAVFSIERSSSGQGAALLSIREFLKSSCREITVSRAVSRILIYKPDDCPKILGTILNLKSLGG